MLFGSKSASGPSLICLRCAYPSSVPIGWMDLVELKTVDPAQKEQKAVGAAGFEPAS